jgi:hypothetical protein
MKKNKKYKLTISIEDKLTALKAASRNVELELGMRIATHRIHKNKKAYDRKQNKKIEY